MYKFSTLTDLLGYRVQEQADRLAYIFLQNNGIELDRLSYRELDSQARSLHNYSLQELVVNAHYSSIHHPPSRQKVSRLMAIIKDAQATVSPS